MNHNKNSLKSNLNKNHNKMLIMIIIILLKKLIIKPIVKIIKIIIIFKKFIFIISILKTSLKIMHHDNHDSYYKSHTYSQNHNFDHLYNH